MEKPELYQLARIDWQFFGTLTFRAAEVPERIRVSMWFAFVRKIAANFGCHFHTLLWCLRQESGEINGRRHFHYLLGGLPEKAVTKSSCFAQMAQWENLRGGMARVRLFDRSLNGIDYIAKDCLGMSGADLYESAKFGSSSSSLMLSKGVSGKLVRIIREERRVVQRLEKKSVRCELGKVESSESVPPVRIYQLRGPVSARGDASSAAYLMSAKFWKKSPEAFYEIIDQLSSQKAEKS